MASLASLIGKRILILDGAMGTLLQRKGFQEKDFRGDRFKDHPVNLKGNYDVLPTTQPQAVYDVHIAGADIVETCSFNATKIGQAEYHMEHHVHDLNMAAARVAKQACSDMTLKTPNKPRFVAGSIGPTAHSLTLATSMAESGKAHAVMYSFNDVKNAYAEQIEGLIDGGADALLLETITDGLNTKAALMAATEVFGRKSIKIPVFVSCSVVDKSGRVLAGQTPEAFLASVASFDIVTCFGMNCSLGAEEMAPFLKRIASISPFHIICYPNAGLPDQDGHYHQSPDSMGRLAASLASDNLLSIVGGCCGTTPDHIGAVASAVADYAPFVPKTYSNKTWLSGLQLLEMKSKPENVSDDEILGHLYKIGERCNVYGSKKFAKLIRADNFEEAVEVAREQVQQGAHMLDICVDDGMLDIPVTMTKFVKALTVDPDASSVPFVLDSANFDALVAGLSACQGKCLVNSLSLKDGEAKFIERAKIINSYGAALVVMAMDENGQATSMDDRVRICKRAYECLVHNVGFHPHNIVFDVNVMSIGTGMSEHASYAVDFINSIPIIKTACPGVRFSGGVSNLSFAFRSHAYVRSVMHSIFLVHALRAGLDMAIIHPSPSSLPIPSAIDKDLYHIVESLILNTSHTASDDLLKWIEQHKDSPATAEPVTDTNADPAARLIDAIKFGIPTYVRVDVESLMTTIGTPLGIIDGPLMTGMKHVGELFGQGKMFLSQVIKSARIMKMAVDQLQPYFSTSDRQKSSGTILLATVKGDVHDIGKNIVKVVLECNGFVVRDLGVNVPCADIVKAAASPDVDLIGLSGLIAPSLEEMCVVVSSLAAAGVTKPIMIGGAATSAIHTAARLAPLYRGVVVHVLDASLSATVCFSLMNPIHKDSYIARIKEKQETVIVTAKQAVKPSAFELAKTSGHAGAVQFSWLAPKPVKTGIFNLRDYDLGLLVPYIDWTHFFYMWSLKPSDPKYNEFPAILDDPVIGAEAKRVYDSAQELLQTIVSTKAFTANAVYCLVPASRHDNGEDMCIYRDEVDYDVGKVWQTFHGLRQQDDKSQMNVADFINRRETGPDYLGMFICTAGHGVDAMSKSFESQHDDFHAIMTKIIATRLAEAFAERVHHIVRSEVWGIERSDVYTSKHWESGVYQGIRPALGYPILPDHTEKLTLFSVLDGTASTDIILTSSMDMTPFASVCGLILGNPKSRYFAVRGIGADQVVEYAERKGQSVESMKKWLSNILNE